MIEDDEGRVRDLMAWARGHPEDPGVVIDPSVPSIARVYDAVLGGKDNFAADRAVVEERMKAFPDGGRGARINREFLARGVRYMARQGIDQFLDLGSGLPTVQNTHEVAQAVNPDARVVYVDNDPIVLVHGGALLAADERTAVVTADLRDTDEVLGLPGIDLSRPLGLMLVAVVHHLGDEDAPHEIVEAYKQALAPGSFLLLAHFCSCAPETAAIGTVLRRALGSGRPRSPAEIAAFFDGLEPVEPGIVHLPLWRPDAPVSLPLDLGGLLCSGGLARKP